MKDTTGDWPTAGGNNRRTGVSRALLKPPLRMRWRCKEIQHPTGGIVASGDTAVCVSGIGHSIHGIDVRDGRVLWTHSLEGGGTPAISGEYIYAGTAASAVCLDIATGKERWKTSTGRQKRELPGAGDSCPLCVGQLVVYCDEETAAFDAETGEAVFRLPGGNDPGVNMGPCSDEKSLYLIEGRNISRWGLHLDMAEAIARTDGKPTAGPIIGDGMIIYGSSRSIVEALDAQTLERVWTFSVEDPLCYEYQGWMESAPALFKGRVFFGSPDGNVYALDAGTGRRLWKHQTGAPVESSPLVSGDTVFIMTAKKGLHALSAENGRLEWRHDFGKVIREYAPNPAVTHSMILAGADHLYAFASAAG